MKKPTISILIATLNEEKYIGHLMKSLEMQTFPDFEVVIVDGGSKDKTLEEASRYRIKTRTFVIEGGRESYSKDFAVSKAEGSIFLFTNADSIFPRDLVEKVYKKFQQNKQLIVITGPHILYDGPVIGKIEYFALYAFRYLTARLRYAFHSGGSFFAVRKEYFKKVGGFGIEALDFDGVPQTKIAEIYGFSRVEFSPSTYVYISARRMEKMGFIRSNMFYFSWCWGILLPRFIRWHPKVSSFIRRSSEDLKRKHLEMHKAIDKS